MKELIEQLFPNTVEYDETKLCLAIDDDNGIYAWCEPYIIDGEIKASVQAPGKDPVIVSKEDIPKDVDLGDCVYIDGKVVYSPERAEQRLLADLRAQRQEEFAKYDKYQLPYVQATLTEEQIQEYNEWRQAWLDVTVTKVIPKKPLWFD